MSVVSVSVALTLRIMRTVALGLALDVDGQVPPTSVGMAPGVEHARSEGEHEDDDLSSRGDKDVPAVHSHAPLREQPVEALHGLLSLRTAQEACQCHPTPPDVPQPF